MKIEGVQCETCMDTAEVDGAVCQDCCEHAEHDHFICLDCGYECQDGSTWYYLD
jgi:predicted amidophosphoribosyltransferase